MNGKGAALYRHYDASGTLLYVGISLNTINRLSQHRDHSDWFNSITRVEMQHFPTRTEALQAETDAIRTEKPLHNIRKVPRIIQQEEIPASRMDETRGELIKKVVRLNPLYTIDEAAYLLGLASGQIRRLIDSGALGHVDVGTYRSPRRITGWQIIDYLEGLST